VNRTRISPAFWVFRGGGGGDLLAG